jgi:hypothetical protein
MRRTDMLRHLLWSIGLIVFLVGCSSLPAQSTQRSSSPTVQSAQASPSQHARQLKPNAPIPTSCPATPVNIGGQFGSDPPWLQAEPTSSGIVAYLAYSFINKSDTYRLPHVNGFFPEEGLYTKTFWTIDNPHASFEFRIEGTDLSDVNKTFHDTGNAISDSAPPTGVNMHKYTSYLQAPGVGCWRLQITSGKASGSIIMWFVG